MNYVNYFQRINTTLSEQRHWCQLAILRKHNPRERTQTVRNASTAAFISIALIGISGLGGNFQTDPGQKEEVAIGSVKFSCPKGYTVQAVSGFATTRLLRNNKSKGGAGVFVMLPGKNINNEFIEEIANALASALLKKGAAYKWKRDTDYAKASKFETSGGGLLGFDGRTLAAKVRDYERDLCIAKNC